MSPERSAAIVFALCCLSIVPAQSQDTSTGSKQILQGGVSRTFSPQGGSDILVGTVIVTKNPHVHFTYHKDYVSGRVYEPGPTPEECAQAVNTGLSIFNSVMGIVNSYSNYSSGSSGSYSGGSSYSSPPPSYSSPSCSGH